MNEEDLCECCTCGYRWKRGLDGSHRCSENLIKQIKPLKSFADSIINACFDARSLDADQIQDLAVNFGLLKEIEMNESCGDACRCAECDGFPQICYRKTYKITAL